MELRGGRPVGGRPVGGRLGDESDPKPTIGVAKTSNPYLVPATASLNKRCFFHLESQLNHPDYNFKIANLIFLPL